MTRSSRNMLVVCGLAAAVVLMGFCSQSSAHPLPWPHVHPMPHPHPFPHPHPVPYHPHHPVWPIVRPVIVRPVYPVVVSSPIVVSNPLPAIVPVAVVNPANTGATLTYSIDGVRYDLAPGARQELRLPGARTIQFDRGGSFGLATYPLYEGVYTFRATGGGWDLERQPYIAGSLAAQ